MGIFSKKPKVILEELGAYWATLYTELIKGKFFNMIDESQLSEDKRTKSKDEIPFLYTFLLYHSLSDNYSEGQAASIMGAFILLIQLTKNLNEFDDAINSYSNAWDEPFSKKSKNDDDMIWDKPIYMIAKNAAIRAFNTDSPDISDIEMFMGYVNKFLEHIIYYKDKYFV